MIHQAYFEQRDCVDHLECVAVWAPSIMASSNPEGYCGESTPFQRLTNNIAQGPFLSNRQTNPPTSSMTMGAPGSFRLRDLMAEVNQIRSQEGSTTASAANISPSSSAAQRAAEYLNSVRAKMETADQWVEEFKQQEPAGGAGVEGTQSTAEDHLREIQKGWEEMAEASDYDWLSPDNIVFQPFKEYKLAENNPVLSHPSPFEEGLKQYRLGDLVSAVLLFEAAAHKEPTNPEVWRYLGQAQMENENDGAAIAAFRKCLELDPDNSPAMLSLAAAYTNENFQVQAQSVLKDWLSRHPKYGYLVPPSETATVQPKEEAIASLLTVRDAQSNVVDLFLRAAQLSPSDVDPDVQSALGTLFNLKGEYDKGGDCFQAALSKNPEDHLLWNRLGASRANEHKPVEAIAAYRRALELSPGNIRTRSNLGLAVMNMGAYREAVDHFLAALNLQASLGRAENVAEGVWSNLRMAVSLMARSDLFPLIDTR
ncbi:unnamed protein product [Cyprideis torosa]|uniref:Uncharacterized protein n=1 Tax=Cyprideis torosa TaxID=163714 RepID=A0A7R8W8M7_9CRUS|nr:unnamed protein product [Cyprideis torosa]CAG0883378.1 unnamed protein product [Cyprideis torosa]